MQSGEELMKEKPEFAEIVQPKIKELQQQFDDLEVCTKDKGERLFDANREVLVHQTCDDIDSWMTDLEKQIESEDTGSDLASVNILMQKQQVNIIFIFIFFFHSLIFQKYFFNFIDCK